MVLIVTENKKYINGVKMMRLQATSATQPTVPPIQPVQTQSTQSKPSFKGDDELDRDTWKQNKLEFEEFTNNPENPTFLKNIGKAGVVLATGILGYGTAKFGMNKSLDLISGIIKSKPIQSAKAKLSGFVSGILIPDAVSVFKSIKNSKLVDKISQKFVAMASSLSQGKVGKFVSEKLAFVGQKLDAFAQKEKVAKAVNTVKDAGVAASAKASEATKNVKAKIPTADKAKSSTIETLAVGSGMAAAMTGTENPSDLED